MVDRELCVHTLVTSDAYRATVASAPPIQYENPVDVVDRLEDSALDSYAAEMRAAVEVIGKLLPRAKLKLFFFVWLYAKFRVPPKGLTPMRKP